VSRWTNTKAQQTGIAIISRSSAAISGSISESNSIIGVVEGIHIDDYMLV
jgi:hypothetical protein